MSTDDAEERGDGKNDDDNHMIAKATDDAGGSCGPHDVDQGLGFRELWDRASGGDVDALEQLWRLSSGRLRYSCLRLYGQSGEDMASAAFIRLMGISLNPGRKPNFENLTAFVAYLKRCAASEFKKSELERHKRWKDATSVEIEKTNQRHQELNDSAILWEVLREALANTQVEDYDLLSPVSSSPEAQSFWEKADAEIARLDKAQLAEQFLERAIAGLSKPSYREVLRLSFKEKLDPREIASVLKIAPGNARVRLFRARAALAQRLNDLKFTEEKETNDNE